MFIKCIIIDDEPMAIDILRKYVLKIPFLKLEGEFRDPNEALVFIGNNKVDLIILDINMPDLSGVELASLILPQTRIIFTTAYPEFALKGFDFNAVDYVLKPVTYERFLKATLKLKQYIDINEKLSPLQAKVNGESISEMIFFKSGTSIYKIDTHSIRYFEKDGNYFKVFTPDKTLLIRMNFARLTELLPLKYFVRIHKSFIVNLLHIEKINIDSIVVKNNSLPIGLNFRCDLDQAIERFVQN
jgi:two-component system LytT family response regulator